jgi:hypothetical protein
VRGDSPRQIREPNIWIPADPAFLDHAEIPVITPGHLIELEGQWRGHCQEVPDARRIVDSEGRRLSAIGHFQGLAAAHEGPPPRLAREEDANPSVRVYPHDGDVTRGLASEGDPGFVTALVRLLPVSPHTDAGRGLLPARRILSWPDLTGGGGVLRAKCEQQSQHDVHEASRRIAACQHTSCHFGFPS